MTHHDRPACNTLFHGLSPELPPKLPPTHVLRSTTRGDTGKPTDDSVVWLHRHAQRGAPLLFLRNRVPHGCQHHDLVAQHGHCRDAPRQPLGVLRFARNRKRNPAPLRDSSSLETPPQRMRPSSWQPSLAIAEEQYRQNRRRLDHGCSHAQPPHKPCPHPMPACPQAPERPRA